VHLTVPGRPVPKGITRILGLISFLVLCVILYAGLKPFRAPANQITWISNENALRFGTAGTIFTADALRPNSSSDSGNTLEIWMQPGTVNEGDWVVGFYDPKQPRGFALHQSEGDLELRIETSVAWRHAKVSQLYLDKALRDRMVRFWTVASKPSGTAIYRDGAKVKESTAFVISNGEFSGQLIMGTSPIFNEGWPGVVRGLAIYHRALTEEQIARHFEAWTRNGKPELSAGDECVALYLFDEHAGTIVHNKIASRNDLFIPEKYLIVNQTVLDPLWRAFDWSWGFWQDTIINICGFIPVGFFFCACLSANGLRRPALTAALLGTAISLFIEITQVFLPTRDSSMSDLITNISGSVIGAALYQGRIGRIMDGVLARTFRAS
jgi:hypothetical protein